MQKVLAVLCPEPSCLSLPCFNWVYGALPFSREQLWGWGHHQMLGEHHQLGAWPLAVTGLDKSTRKSSFQNSQSISDTQATVTALCLRGISFLAAFLIPLKLLQDGLLIAFPSSAFA